MSGLFDPGGSSYDAVDSYHTYKQTSGGGGGGGGGGRNHPLGCLLAVVAVFIVGLLFYYREFTGPPVVIALFVWGCVAAAHKLWNHFAGPNPNVHDRLCFKLLVGYFAALGSTALLLTLFLQRALWRLLLVPFLIGGVVIAVLAAVQFDQGRAPRRRD